MVTIGCKPLCHNASMGFDSPSLIIVAITIAYCQIQAERRCSMGDKGGKKDKDKARKQKKSKDQQREKQKQDKQPKRTP